MFCFSGDNLKILNLLKNRFFHFLYKNGPFGKTRCSIATKPEINVPDTHSILLHTLRRSEEHRTLEAVKS
jgi:hypothetical protein